MADPVRPIADGADPAVDDVAPEDLTLETLTELDQQTIESLPAWLADREAPQSGPACAPPARAPARRPPLPSHDADTGTGTYPHQLGSYELLIPIGSGATATVYLARTRTGDGTWQYVALKHFHPRALLDDSWLERRALREVKLTGWLRHPNVVSLIDAGEEGGAAYFVMDYVEGDTLSALLRWQAHRRERVPVPIAMRIVSDLLGGLEAVHTLRSDSGRSLEVVHRDVSPPNALVGTNGVTRLIDLGVARVPTWTQVTGNRRILGRLPYVSPEQVAGKPVDQRSDVWSAAVVAWELFAGRRLFPEKSLQALMDRMRVTPPGLLTVRKDLPRALDHALASALTLDARDRCPSAGALLERLSLAWTHHGTIAGPEEVGALVNEAVGAKLREREQAMIALLRYRRALSDLTQTAMRELAEDESTTRALPDRGLVREDEARVCPGEPESEPEKVGNRFDVLSDKGT